MSKKIEISTMNISVNVLMLDNKRFTKSVYNQLPNYGFNKVLLKSQHSGIIILGFVKDNSLAGKSLLVNRNGVLERFSYPIFLHEGNWQNDVDSEDEYDKYVTTCDNYGQIFISC